jgi:hypothetical protein
MQIRKQDYKIPIFIKVIMRPVDKNDTMYIFLQDNKLILTE